MEILAGGTVTGNYVLNCIALFDAALNRSASTIGNGGISPQIGGETGQTNASWGNGQTGNTQVIIVLIGNDCGIALAGDKTALELELEAIFGYGPGPSTGSESGSGSEFGSGSGGPSGGGGGDSPSGGDSVVFEGTVTNDRSPQPCEAILKNDRSGQFAATHVPNQNLLKLLIRLGPNATRVILGLNSLALLSKRRASAVIDQ